MITTLEGLMGSGKSMTASTLTYVRYTNREIERYCLKLFNSKQASPREAFVDIQQNYGVKKKMAEQLVMSAVHAARQGATDLPSIRIYSNISLNIPYVKFDAGYFVAHVNDHEMDDCILLLDEAYLLMDSRSGQTKMNKLGSYFVAQTRKRDVDMYVCVQHVDLVDKRLRRAVDERGTCHYRKEDPCSKCGGTGSIQRRSLISIKNRDAIVKDLVGPLSEAEKCTRCLGYGVTGWATTTFYNKKTRKRRRLTIFGPAVFWVFDTKELVGLTKQQVAVAEEDL